MSSDVLATVALGCGVFQARQQHRDKARVQVFVPQVMCLSTEAVRGQQSRLHVQNRQTGVI